MTKRLKLFLAIILGSIAIACCVAGCRIGEPGRDEILAGYSGGQVIYYANGGNFNNTELLKVREVNYKNADAPFFDISDTENQSTIFVGRGGYEFLGWYLPARYEEGEHAGEIKYTYTYNVNEITQVTVPAYPRLNEDGTPVTDNTTTRPVFYYIDQTNKEKSLKEDQVSVVVSEEKVTSERSIGSDEQLVVCAKWKRALSFVFKLAVDESFEYEGVTYEHGTELSRTTIKKDESKLNVEPDSGSQKSFMGMTFLANYADEPCHNMPTTYNWKEYEEQGIADIVIWSKYITGNWTVVKDAKSVGTMFTNAGLNTKGRQYFLFCDIDCESLNLGVIPSINVVIDGNGKTLSNLKFSGNAKNGDSVAPVFGAIQATAQIKNLKLDNITIDMTGNGNMYFRAICKSVAEGAIIDGLEVSKITATVDVPSGKMVYNTQNGGDVNSWIFSKTDKSFDTDATFVNNYGVTLSGTNTLTIK